MEYFEWLWRDDKWRQLKTISGLGLLESSSLHVYTWPPPHPSLAISIITNVKSKLWIIPIPGEFDVVVVEGANGGAGQPAHSGVVVQVRETLIN